MWLNCPRQLISSSLDRFDILTAVAVAIFVLHSLSFPNFSFPSLSFDIFVVCYVYRKMSNKPGEIWSLDQ